MQEYLHSSKVQKGRLLACAAVILACALPVHADTFPASHALASDGLFDPSLLVSASEFPSLGRDLVVQAEEYEVGLAFAAFPTITGTLDLLADGRDSHSESGEEGLRRFILLAILFGGALRYLTSPAFYEWAADVFDPLDGY